VSVAVKNVIENSERHEHVRRTRIRPKRNQRNEAMSLFNGPAKEAKR
jgi:hypothetical protein